MDRHEVPNTPGTGRVVHRFYHDADEATNQGEAESVREQWPTR